ncbi:hypothetical protein O3G_MSEX007432 [Manduca sexta]|uniref:Major facilitator superfamily (MFS) profile domain-containing protein n=1 Tax=Manduca sexta TaxID=7130 RepID=A0A921Z781_MANSE|nr:hypothetical protein O3G_MSEX007432 [Manduca sexta]
MGGATYEVQPPRPRKEVMFQTVGDASKPEINSFKPKRSDSEISFENINNSKEDDESSGFEEVPGIRVFKSEDYVAQKPQTDLQDKWRWIVLAAASMIMVIVDGVGFSFGHLSGELAHKFNASQLKISLIGSLFIAIPLLTGPIMSALVDRCGCRVLTIVAGVFLSGTYLLASVCNSVTFLCLTYGLIGGLAVGILYVTTAVSVSFWFDVRRTLAMNIVSCSFGIGPLIFTPLIQYLLSYYYCLDVIFILAAVLLNICVCGTIMRNPYHWSKREEKNKKIQSLDSTNSLANSTSLPSRCSSGESSSSIPLRVIMNMEREEENRKTDPAMSPAQGKLTESPSDANYGIDSKDKTDNKENTKKGKSMAAKQIQLRNWCKAMLIDQHYLKRIALFRNSIVQRSAMTSIPKYRLRSSLRPDVYSNSSWSLSSEVEHEMKWYLRFWVTPEIMSDSVTAFKNTGYILFNVCLFNLYAWSIFPYFFIKSFMDSKYAAGATSIICVVSIFSVIGSVLCSWVREKPWMNVMVFYRSCIILCGLSLAACPLFITYYWVMVFISVVYGFTLASCYVLSPVILMELVPMEQFSVTYCVALLVQGFGYLVGPLVGGELSLLV